MKIRIKNGRIITATEDFIGDILIEGEKVVALGKKLQNTEGGACFSNISQISVYGSRHVKPVIFLKSDVLREIMVRL